MNNTLEFMTGVLAALFVLWLCIKVIKKFKTYETPKDEHLTGDVAEEETRIGQKGITVNFINDEVAYVLVDGVKYFRRTEP